MTIQRAALANLQQLARTVRQFPWRATVQMLGLRFREDRMGLTASSLTFTTTLALVPFFTVALAIFSAFPMFSKLQGALQTWLIDSLIPENIARQVLGYLTQFSRQASKLGVLGLAALLVSSIALILTIDRTLNSIWRVKQPRPLAQRLLMYWAGLTAGPVLLGASLALTSFVVSRSLGWTSGLPFSLSFLAQAFSFALVAGGVAALYRYVPNTAVRWAHAWAGGVFVALGIELAKRLLSLYLAQVPGYSAIYGAFATAPILLLWIYVLWLIVLFGAVIAAYLPSLLSGVQRRTDSPGWPFQLALEVLQALYTARGAPGGIEGLSLAELAKALRLQTLQLESVLQTLQALKWVAPLQAGGLETLEAELSYVLLADPAATRLQPLVQQLLLGASAESERFWANSQLGQLNLADVFKPKVALAQ